MKQKVALIAALAHNPKVLIMDEPFVIITSALTLIEGIYKSGNLLFNCKDDNLLLSLPIKRGTVLFIRVFKFYVFELLYNSLFLLPAIIVYAINMNPGITYIAKNASSINDFITRLYYPAGAYIELITNFSVLKLLEFIIVNLGLFIVTIILIGFH